MSFIAACQNPIGMENPSIRNIRVTSPDNLSSPNFARLNGRFAWCTTKQTYLQVNLGKRHQLTAIATQGGQDNTGIISWMTKYKLSFFAGPRKEIFYQESGTQQVRITPFWYKSDHTECVFFFLSVLIETQSWRISDLSCGAFFRYHKIIWCVTCTFAFWSELLEGWLALTSVNYQRNVEVSILLTEPMVSANHASSNRPMCVILLVFFFIRLLMEIKTPPQPSLTSSRNLS